MDDDLRRNVLIHGTVRVGHVDQDRLHVARLCGARNGDGDRAGCRINLRHPIAQVLARGDGEGGAVRQVLVVLLEADLHPDLAVGLAVARGVQVCVGIPHRHHRVDGVLGAVGVGDVHGERGGIAVLRALRGGDLQRAALGWFGGPPFRCVDDGVGGVDGGAADVARLCLQRDINGATRLDRVRRVVGGSKLGNGDGTGELRRVLINNAVLGCNAQYLWVLVGVEILVLGGLARVRDDLHVNLRRLVVINRTGRALGEGDVDLAGVVDTHLGALDLLASDGNVAGQTLVVVLRIGHRDAGVVLVAVRDDRLGLLLRSNNWRAVIGLKYPRGDFNLHSWADAGLLSRQDRRIIDPPGPRLRLLIAVHSQLHNGRALLITLQRKRLLINQRNLVDIKHLNGLIALALDLNGALLQSFKLVGVGCILRTYVFNNDERRAGLKHPLTVSAYAHPRHESVVYLVEANTHADPVLGCLQRHARVHRGDVLIQHNSTCALLWVRGPTRRACEFFWQRGCLRGDNSRSAEGKRNGARSNLLRNHEVSLEVRCPVVRPQTQPRDLPPNMSELQTDRKSFNI